jgi:hypothetical protein
VLEIERWRGHILEMNITSPVNRTVLLLGTVFFAFKLEGYVTRFSWSHGGWVATTIDGAALVVCVLLLIRGFWKTNA